MDGGIGNSSSTYIGTTINLNGDGESVTDLTGKVHQLPCCIKHDGPTSVSHYFRPKPTEIEIDGLRVEEAYFRGRKLQGTTLPLPLGYSGFVLGKKNSAKRAKITEEIPSCWELNAKFQNVTIWNHDSLPSQDDSFMRAFHWFAVAKALHQPAKKEDLESTTSICQELD